MSDNISPRWREFHLWGQNKGNPLLMHQYVAALAKQKNYGLFQNGLSIVRGLLMIAVISLHKRWTLGKHPQFPIA